MGSGAGRLRDYMANPGDSPSGRSEEIYTEVFSPPAKTLGGGEGSSQSDGRAPAHEEKLHAFRADIRRIFERIEIDDLDRNELCFAERIDDLALRVGALFLALGDLDSLTSRKQR